MTIPIEITIEDAEGGRWGLPVNVTFNAGQTKQSINFTATDDDVDDDSGQVIVRFDTSLLDNVAAGNQTTVRITDNDQRGVSVTPAILTVDEGGSDSYDVVLTSEPTGGDVRVEITPPANTDITVDPAELTFTTVQLELAADRHGLGRGRRPGRRGRQGDHHPRRQRRRLRFGQGRARLRHGR